MDNRFYVLSLKANRDSFPWIVQDFQNWLAAVRILSRQDSGKLESPAHGGLWVHQTGGAKIEIPQDWLIGVADDHELGATIARDKMHLALTAVVDALAPAPRAVPLEWKTQAGLPRKEKGRPTGRESEAPLTGRPALRLASDVRLGGGVIR